MHDSPASLFRFPRLLGGTVAVLLLGAVLVSSSRPAVAADPPALARDESVDRGLAYLARQQRADGSLAAELKPGSQDTAGPKLAVTGLAMLAFLAEGDTPDVGRYGLVVRGALDYLVSQVPEDGYVGAVDGSRMYGQGIVTLALAEAYGVETVAPKRRQEGAALQKLVAVILKAQQVEKPAPYAGGWRYEPRSQDSDISLSGWSALALRAVQDVGIPVPRESLARAAGFVARCYLPDQKLFGYQPGNTPRLGATGTGVLCLYLLDAGPEERGKAAEAARGLAAHLVEDPNAYPYYTLYYVTHAAFAAGDDVWNEVSKVTLERLVKAQSPDGSWPVLPGGTQEPSRVYRTSMAVLTLAVPQRLLPIFQR